MINVCTHDLINVSVCLEPKCCLLATTCIPPFTLLTAVASASKESNWSTIHSCPPKIPQWSAVSPFCRYERVTFIGNPCACGLSDDYKASLEIVSFGVLTNVTTTYACFMFKLDHAVFQKHSDAVRFIARPAKTMELFVSGRFKLLSQTLLEIVQLLWAYGTIYLTTRNDRSTSS